MRAVQSCTDCWRGRVNVCTFCGACPHEIHSEECRQNWRDLILGYKVKEKKS